MTRVKSPQDEVNLWNREHGVGTLVRYWKGVRELDTPKVGRTRSRAEVLSGHTAVVWIDGCRGCVALTEVDPIAVPKITDAQRCYLEHALGVAVGRDPSRWGYRNFYAADVGSKDHDQCRRLVELGLMREVRSDEGLVRFRCTRDGCIAAGLSEDRIAEALR